MIKSYIISQYPLPLNYLDQFERLVGDRPEPLIISHISARGLIDVLCFLRSLKVDVVYLVKTDKSDHPILPILKCLSQFIRAKRRVLIEPDFSSRTFGIFDSIKALSSVGFGCLLAILELPSYWLKLRGLSGGPLTQFLKTHSNKILYIKPNLWPGVYAGGAIAHTNGVISSFLGKKLEVDYASVEPPATLPESARLTYLHMDSPEQYVIPHDLNFYTHSIRSFKQIIEKEEHSYGVIYQRHSTGNLTGVLASRYWSLPLILEYNGSEVWVSENWGRPLFFKKLAMRAEEACLRHATLIVTVSEVLRAELIGKGVKPEKIVTCPNGVNSVEYDHQRFSEEQIADVRDQYGISRDAVIATFVGTFGHWHGVEELAKTLRLMADENREWLIANKLHIMFVGNGAKRELVEEILSSPDLQPFFTLTGLIPQNQAPQYMAASDILISPHVPNPDGSPFFGSPTKLFEYLSTGRAVIASNLGQIGEILEGCPMVSENVDYSQAPGDGVYGVLVNPREPKELRSALMTLIENPQWSRQAGLNGRMRAIERYTWDHHTDIILDKMASILMPSAQASEG